MDTALTTFSFGDGGSADGGGIETIGGLGVTITVGFGGGLGGGFGGGFGGGLGGGLGGGHVTPHPNPQFTEPIPLQSQFVDASYALDPTLHPHP